MSFKIFTDSAANLPSSLLRQRDIAFITMTYSTPDGAEHPCQLPDEDISTDAVFEDIRKNHTHLRTSMLTPEDFRSAFEPYCRQGTDVLYVGMSGGISGTFASSCMAAKELADEYPGVEVITVDTLGAALGEGFLALEAADLRDSGISIRETARRLDVLKLYMCQCFIVDDLVSLRRGGRLSGGAASAGTLMNIKPILIGDAEGKIVCVAKERGRTRAINALADMFERQVAHPESQTVGITHAGCRADAEALAAMLRARVNVRDFMIVDYDVGTGSHVGPGALALFFYGDDARTVPSGGVKKAASALAHSAAHGAAGAMNALRAAAAAVRDVRAARKEQHQEHQEAGDSASPEHIASDITEADGGDGHADPDGE